MQNKKSQILILLFVFAFFSCSKQIHKTTSNVIEGKQSITEDYFVQIMVNTKTYKLLAKSTKTKIFCKVTNFTHDKLVIDLTSRDFRFWGQGSNQRIPLYLTFREDFDPSGNPLIIEPQSESVVFSVNLHELFTEKVINRENQNTNWYWTWKARAAAPLSPIHDGYDTEKLQEKVNFWFTINYNEKEWKSNVVELEIE